MGHQVMRKIKDYLMIFNKLKLQSPLNPQQNGSTFVQSGSQAIAIKSATSIGFRIFYFELTPTQAGRNMLKDRRQYMYIVFYS
jgi:hypothetical protein